MSKATWSLLLILLLGGCFVSESVAQTHKGISFQGVIKLPTGDYPTRSGITINARILSPNGCVLREEEFSGVNVSNGYINLSIGTGVVGGYDPSLTLAKVMDNSAVKSPLVCLNSDGTVNGSVNSFNPAMTNGARKFRLSLTIDSYPIVADFNMRAVAYAINSETLNGKSDTDFIAVNNAKNLNQANMESIFQRFTKLDALLNNSDGTGTNLGVNITGIANNVSGVVAVANGGTGASDAATARTNLGLGPLAIVNPTGTADATTYLRGDGTWATVSSVGSETDPTVQSFAKNAPGTGLSVVSNQLTVSYGTTAGTAAQGNDSRITGAFQSSTTLSGDLSGTLPSPVVEKIKGQSISAAGTSTGQVLRYAGANTWTPGFVSMSDLRSTVTGSAALSGTGCTAGETLSWSSVSDSLACITISITKSQISDFPTLAASATTDTTDATNITAGTLSVARLPTSVTDGLWTASSPDIYRTSGKVGIGTSTPQSNLHVGTAPTASANAPLFALGSAPFDGSSGGHFVGNSNGTVIGANTAAGYTGDFLNFEIAGSSKFKIDSSGTITSGGNIVSSGNTTSTGNYSTTGNISTTGTGSITSAGPLISNSTTASTSPSTGALIVGGGAGIGGALNVGGAAYLGNSSANYVTINGAGSGSSPTITASGSDANINLTLTPKGSGNTIISSGYMGIGTTTPFGALHIDNNNGADAADDIWLTTYSNSATPSFISVKARGNESSPSATLSGDTLFTLSMNGHTGSAMKNAAVMKAIATSDFSVSPTADLTFWTNGGGAAATERMRITSAGNVGIGTTAPTQKLQVSGAISSSPGIGTIGSDTASFVNIQVGQNATDGSNVGARVVMSDLGTSGKRWDMTNGGLVTGALAFKNQTDNIIAMTLAGSGNVGIGTTAPAASLVVSKTAPTGTIASTGTAVSGAGTNFTTAFSVGDQIVASGQAKTITAITNASNMTVNAAFSSDLTAGTSYARVGTILSAGNVGIGTSQPLYSLHVNGDASLGGVIFKGQTDYDSSASVYPIISRSSTGGSGAFPFNTNGNLVLAPRADGSNIVFATGATTPQTRMVIAGGGNVGIGTTTPAYQLAVANNQDATTGVQISNSSATANALAQYRVDVAGGIGISFAAVPASHTGTLSGYAGYAVVEGNANTNGLSLASAMSTGIIDFRVGGRGLTDRKMVINSTGNVGIGTTSPGYKLDVNGDTNIASGSALRFGGTQVCTSAGCTSSSDRNLKENIQPLQNSLEKVLKLQGVEYDYKDKVKFTDKHQVGVIAQDVEKVYPEVVLKDPKTGLRSVAYDHLVGPLIEAFKSLYQRVVGIESRQAMQDRDIASVKAAKADQKDLESAKAQIKKLEAENTAMKAYLCSKDPTAVICK